MSSHATISFQKKKFGLPTTFQTHWPTFPRVAAQLIWIEQNMVGNKRPCLMISTRLLNVVGRIWLKGTAGSLLSGSVLYCFLYCVLCSFVAALSYWVNFVLPPQSIYDVRFFFCMCIWSKEIKTVKLNYHKKVATR